MKPLTHIGDRSMPNLGEFSKRFAVRAILFDENGLMPILFVSKYKYHKLPGGGIEKDESKINALRREVKEEAGCLIDVTNEIGIITEYRSKFKLFQTSYCYLGKVVHKGKQYLEQGEVDEGFRLVWCSLPNAISALKKDKPLNYEGKFIQKRDLRFLEEAKICLEK